MKLEIVAIGNVAIGSFFMDSAGILPQFVMLFLSTGWNVKSEIVAIGNVAIRSFRDFSPGFFHGFCRDFTSIFLCCSYRHVGMSLATSQLDLLGIFLMDVAGILP